MKLPALLVAPALALLAGVLRADTITLGDGTVIDNVRIVSESFEKVEYRKPKAQASQFAKTADIRSIEYGETPADLREGDSQLQAGNVANAARYYATVAADASLPAHLRALARMEQADALLAMGQLEVAASTCDQLLRESPDTRHFARALLLKGRALYAGNKLTEAAAAFATLKAEASARNLGERWALEAELHGLLVLEAQQHPDKAAAGYEALAARAGAAHPDVASGCTLGLARIQLGKGQFDAALPLFESVIAARLDADHEVAAAAFNGRGRTHYEQGVAALARAQAAKAGGDGAAEDAERAAALAAFRAARLDFLRVYTSYPEVVAQQPEAMYWAARCFLAIDDDEAKSRADALLQRCQQQYPESTWGRKAAEGA